MHPVNIVISSLFTLFLLAGIACSKVQSEAKARDPEASTGGPSILHFDRSVLSESDKKSLAEAEEDFGLVLKGVTPRYAKADAALLDGGTLYYTGDGYKIKFLKRIATVKGVSGFFYGPIVYFGEKRLFENEETVSNLQFYSNSEMEKLEGKKAAKK